MKTVQEASAVTLTFGNSLPADTNCKLLVTFPSDMPVTTDLVTYNSGTNLMNTASTSLSATGTVTGVATSTSSAYILGCSTYQESGLSSQVTFTNMYNIAEVKTTGSFTLSLYAVSGGVDYNIAQYTSLTIDSS